MAADHRPSLERLGEALSSAVGDVQDAMHRVSDYESRSRETPRLASRPVETDLATLERVREAAPGVGRRLDQPFSVAVMGQFSSGKSTLTNALLRREVCWRGRRYQLGADSRLAAGGALAADEGLAPPARGRFRAAA